MSATPSHSGPYDRFLRHPFMSAAGVAACDARAFVTVMCAFEVALARVEEQAGNLPAGAAAAIARHVDPDAFDLEALATQAPDSGNVAIPFVKQAKALLPRKLKPCFHHSATSQDVIDTALMLMLKPRLARCLELLAATIDGGAELMQTHARTPMIGRTLMQQALPITFGAKVAQWLVGLATAEKRLRDIHAHGLFVQLGGPVGTTHGLTHGLELMSALATELDLNCPILPWHTNRQPMLALIDAQDAIAVGLEKMATDIALMAQTEVAEVREPPATGSGGSSSMPHKSNPVGCTRIRAAARQIHAAASLLHHAAAQPNERALGEWQAEWAPLVDATLLLEGALETAAILLPGLEVDAERMRINLAATGGANLLVPTIGLLNEVMPEDRARQLANEAAHTARQQHIDYADALISIPEIARTFDADRIRAAVDPAAYVGTSVAQTARVLEWLHAR